MSHEKLRSLASALVGLFALMASTLSVAGPVTIDFELTALAAQGRYEYRYTLTNVSLATPLSWFSVDFDTALYNESSLLITSAGLGDWSEQILASALAVPAQYDAYKTGGAPLGVGDFQTGFTVAFTWLGAGAPGSQAFTIFDPTTFDVLDTGVTTPVPELSTAALALLGLCCIAAFRRHSGSQVAARRTA